MVNYDEETEVVEVEEEQEVEVEEQEEEQEEDTTDWKKVAEETKAELKKKKKAIIKNKTAKELKTAVASAYSLADTVAIQNAKIHEDDIDRVERYAKENKVSIREALKDPELKAILAYREETRTTANATNTSNTRRGSTQTPADVLIANATAGKLPETDADIERLIAAKRKQS